MQHICAGCKSPDAGRHGWDQKSVSGAADASWTMVQNMGVDHGRADVRVAREFLDSHDARSPGMPARCAPTAPASGKYRLDRLEGPSVVGLVHLVLHVLRVRDPVIGADDEDRPP